jgi:hypothetical protein
MKLNAATRNALPAKDFALPAERKFPLEDKAHADAALSRAAHKGGSTEATVKAKVKKKFPSIKVGGKSDHDADDAPSKSSGLAALAK